MSLRVLVSGVSGFVGSSFAKVFARAGIQVCGLDVSIPPRALEQYVGTFVHSDISDEEKVSRLLTDEKIDAIVHCAALCLVAESVEKPDLYLDHNFTRASTFLETAVAAGVKTFLFSSTAAVYGDPKKVLIPEDHPRKPINPYGESKCKFEDALLAAAQAGKVCAGIFRYFNASGADPEGEIGEHHTPETHLIPNGIRAALDAAKSVHVFGSDYDTRDGTCERDYIHVWDLADAHVRLLYRMHREQRGGVYNLGTGRGYTVKEVLDEIDRQVDSPIRRISHPRRPGDPAVLVADPTAAKRDLAWTAPHSDLSTIVRDALTYFRSRR